VLHRSAKLAWGISQKYKSEQIADFDNRKVAVMEEIFRAKLEQHEDVKEILLGSEDALIIKSYPDPFWGIGLDGIGRNENGHHLDEVAERATSHNMKDILSLLGRGNTAGGACVKGCLQA